MAHNGHVSFERVEYSRRYTVEINSIWKTFVYTLMCVHILEKLYVIRMLLPIEHIKCNTCPELCIHMYTVFARIYVDIVFLVAVEGELFLYEFYHVLRY